MRAGMGLLHAHGHLPKEPTFLEIYPVSHPPTRARLAASLAASTATGHAGGPQAETPPAPSVAELKKAAIVDAVERAFAQYGQSPHHRFGMSDDDANNLRLALEAMRLLKRRFPDNAFFVIDSSQPVVIKTEVFVDHLERESVAGEAQLRLFD